jgi:hypothetical protein
LLEQVLQRQLRGRTLQVITKACNYVLRPGESHQGSSLAIFPAPVSGTPPGNWHVEGMPTEHIVASVIYYYQSSPFLEDDGLAFRRERDEEADFPNIMDCACLLRVLLRVWNSDFKPRSYPRRPSARRHA